MSESTHVDNGAGESNSDGTTPVQDHITNDGTDEAQGSSMSISRIESEDQLAANQIIVGIPTFNEEIAIGSVVLQSQTYADEVIVVDDGSADRTAEIAEAAEATVIKHVENTGKGGALRTLLSHARSREMDALVVLDGDGQHKPANIPGIAEPVLDDDCDITIGSRYLEQKETETPLHRRFGQKVLDYLTLGSSGQNLTDTQSGFRAFSPEAVSQLNIRTDGMGVESEMIGSAAERGLEIKEVPINVRYDGIDGQTYNPMQHGLTVAAFITQLVRDRHPLLFFGFPAIFLLVFGGGIMTHSAWLYQSTGALHQWRIIISGFTILLGTISLFCGLVLSQVQNMISDIK